LTDPMTVSRFTPIVCMQMRANMELWANSGVSRLTLFKLEKVLQESEKYWEARGIDFNDF